MASKSLLSESVDFYIQAAQDNRTRRNRSKTVEYEIRFTPNYREGNRPINVVQFNRVIRSLMSHGFELDASNYQMKVIPSYINEKGYTQQSRTRLEINDLGGIQQLCQTNNVPEKSNFVTKKYFDFGIEGKNPFKNDDYMFRASIQTEEMKQSTNNDVVSLMREWNDSLKLFRYIHRMSFVHKAMGNIRVDMSKVKSNFKDLSRTFTQSQVLDKKETYEIEIEATNNEDINKTQLLTELKKSIRYICNGLQNTEFPLPLKMIESSRALYYNILGTSIPKYNDSKTFIGPSSYTLQKINLIKYEDEPQNTQVSIQDEFCVTDKADGERNLMLVSENGKCYFINTNMEFMYTGFTITNKKLYGTIIDGEMIKYDKYGNIINVYAMFDMYFLNKRDVRTFPFYLNDVDVKEQKMRYELLKKVGQMINMEENQKYDSEINRIAFEVKHFAFSNKEDPSSIFKASKMLLSRINSNTYVYNTDGLIYTSKVLGVGQEKPSKEVKNYKYTWGHSFKWKPPKYNTIDFLIKIQKKNGVIEEFAKQVNGEIQKYAIVYLYVGFDPKRHGNVHSQKDILNLTYENRETSSSRNTYEPKLFYPSDPYDDQAHICHVELKYDDAGTFIMYTEENEIIEDDSIVEFSYDNESVDKYQSWSPLRVRYDKTSEYRNGGKNFGNSYHVANSNWKTIKDPISEDMLIRGDKISMETVLLQDKDVYYNGNKKHSKTIALRNFHNLYVKNALIESTTKKNSPKDNIKLLDLAVGKAGDLPKWMNSNVYAVLGIDINYDNIHNANDGACTRLLNNHRDRKPHIPISIFIQGNTSRLLETGEFAQEQGNGNRKIELEEKYDEEGELIQEAPEAESYKILQSLMGVGTRETSAYPFTKKYFGLFETKFDVVSIQFALHYMFEDKKSLHSFAKNVADYTKLGKYFIGTCYDGKMIYEELKDKKSGEKKELYVGNKKIWHVTKLYEDDENKFMEDEEESLGYKIKVYQETINKDFKEYLVNFDYFVKVMQDYGFSVYDELQMHEKKQPGIGNFKLLHDHMMTTSKNDKYGKAYNMSEEEKQISFLNNYFVFRKERDVDTNLLYTYHVEENEVTEPKSMEITKPIKLNRKIILSQA